MRRLRRQARGLLRDLAVLAWPGPCFHCGGALGPIALAGACLECWASLAPALRARVGGGTAGEDEPIAAALVYEGFAVSAHRRLKFEGATELALPLARHLLAAWKTARREGTPIDAHVLAVPPDPLRLPPRRLAARRLASAFARLAGLPSAPRRALRRRHARRSQTSQPAAERRASLQDAFDADPEAVRGRVMILVDDVTTTGTTLDRARDALRAAGAARVDAWALAETPLRQVSMAASTIPSRSATEKGFGR